MYPSPSENSDSKQGGLLRTTTWGTLIAFSLLIAGLGLTGHLFHPLGNPQVLQTAANTTPHQATALLTAARDSYNGGSTGRDSSRASTPYPYSGIAENSAVASPSLATANGSPVLSHTPPAGTKDLSALQQGPVSGAPSTDAASLPTQIAAKIAPDLKGLDPAKPVDVIVQFKRLAGVTAPT